MLKEWNTGMINALFRYSSIPLRYSILPSRQSLSTGQSGNHAALEHFIRDRTGDAVEKLSTHLRVLAKHCQRFLLDHFPFRRLWLALFLHQVLARTALVFLDDFIGQLIHYRKLLRAGESNLKQ
jgi:hypothetical protein